MILSSVKILWGDQGFFLKLFEDRFTDPEKAIWWGWTYDFLATFLLFACIPFSIQQRAQKHIPSIGSGVGDYRFGLKATGIAFLILPLAVWAGAQGPTHLAMYPLSSLATSSLSAFLLWNLLHLFHYIGWEAFYRGFIGLGMRPLLGSFGALSLQVLSTTLMHIDKPMGETVGAFVGGIYLGLLTYRTGSIWYAVLFHAYLGALNTYFCA
ncbi:MAG: lysostaphin resistance A-like protein [Flavobacteriales bacterium]